jgi:Carbohydrate-selective porin, OprB family/S-layer homology domain
VRNDWLAGSLCGLGILTCALPGSAIPSKAPEIPSENGQTVISEGVPAGIAPPESLPVLESLPVNERSQPNLTQPDLSEQSADDPMAQVTSVSQLSDIKPGDWAFQAIQTLVERYGVITGYPDGTFKGNRPLTRYEFSAALNAVIGKIEERLLLGDLAGEAQQDALTVRRLLKAYGNATEDLRKRVNDLTNRNLALVKQEFSTTTKLNGQTVFAATDGTDDTLALVSRTRLTLTTSFDGRDRLITQLEAGNNGDDAISTAHNRRQNLLGTAGLLADGGGLDYVDVDSRLRLRKLYYVFQPAPNLEVAVGSSLPPSDFIDRNSFANNTAENFASSFFSNNPLIVQNEIDRFGGAGAALSWTVQNNLTLRALYAAADASNPSGTVSGGGLFGDRYQASLEAEYTLPQLPIILRLQYTHAEINGTTINAGGINAEWAIKRQFGVFGRLGIGSYQGFNTAIEQDLDLNPISWALGFTVRNFLIPGSKAGVAIGQPFVESKLGSATQTNLEAYFGLLLNDHINFSPSFMVVTNPNDRSSPTIYQWAIRFVIEY